jgi:hypothetical protein
VRAGRFDEAIEAQERAIAHQLDTGSRAGLTALRANLARYRAEAGR